MKRKSKKMEDYDDLLALRKAKVDPSNQKGHPLNEVAKKLGLRKNKK